MNEQDKCALLDDKIRQVINNFADEWDIPVSSVVGILHIIAYDQIRNAGDEDDDDF